MDNKLSVCLVAGMALIGTWTTSALAQSSREPLPDNRRPSEQFASLNGYVTDATSEETLIYANVVFKGTTRGVSTNNNGYYSLTNLKPGTYTITCSYVGFDYFEKEVELRGSQNLRLDIALKPVSIESEELTVTAKAEERELRNIGMASMETAVIEQVPSVMMSDVFRSVQLLPGIKSANDFSSGLYIRGGGPDQTLILLDQTTVYNPSHFFGFYSTFNSDAIKDVRLLKGGYNSAYGGRIGSVLDIYNKDGNRREGQRSVTVGLLASRALIEGPMEWGSYMVAVRRSTIEPVLSVLRRSQDNIPSSFYFLDVNSKVNFDLSKNDKLTASFYMGQDNLTFPFAEDAIINFYYGNRSVSTKYTHIFSQKLFVNVVGTYSNYFSLPGIDFADTPIENTNRINDLSVKSDLQYFPNSRHQIESGFWGGSFNFTYNYKDNGKLVFDEGINTLYGSFYIKDEWQVADRWKVSPGLRLNYFGDGGYTRLAPRLSAEYMLTQDVRLQAAAGRYYQFLTLVSNEAFSGFDFWLASADQVPPAYGDQFVLGAKIRLSDQLNFDVEGYYRTMNDLFELDPTLPDPGGVPYHELFRYGSGYAYGTELLLQKAKGRVNGFLSYTYGISRRKWGDQVNNNNYFAPKYDRTHDANVVVNYLLSNRWYASAVFSYATGQAYTKPLGRYQTSEAPFDYLQLDVFNVGEVNASRLPAYHRLDLAFTRQNGTFFGMGDTQWKFELINVYNHKNVWFYSYDFKDNPISRSAVTMLPVIPSVSYTVNF